MVFYMPPVSDDDGDDSNRSSESDSEISELDEDELDSHHVTPVSLKPPSLFTVAVFLQIMVVLSMAFFWLWVPVEQPV